MIQEFLEEVVVSSRLADQAEQYRMMSEEDQVKLAEALIENQQRLGELADRITSAQVTDAQH